eukprot:5598641-Pyramimonas_sp.AAC.1
MAVGRFWSLPGGFGRPEDRRLERREAEKRRTPKPTENQQKINYVCLLGPSWECSWRPLWGRRGSLLGHIEVTSVTPGALLCCLG